MIRNVTEEDAAAIAAIYAHHVLHGTASYDTEPPSPDDTSPRSGRRAIGPSSSPKRRACRRLCLRHSVPRSRRLCLDEREQYLRPPRLAGAGRGQGFARASREEAEAFGFRQMIGVIGGAEPASVGLHASCGFREVGRLMPSAGRTAAGSTTFICSARWERGRQGRRKLDLGEVGSPASGEGERWGEAS